ncbi:MAG: hypothetical protein ACJ77M_11240 [Thermoleophilaceae bacterium]
MRTRAFTVRMAGLMALGSLTVHQLRFLLWYGHGSDGALRAQGHAYLAVVGPAVVAAAVVAGARFLHRLARGARTSAPRFARLWAGLSAALVAIYCVQESVEGLLSGGHPGGVDGILGHGGWLCMPLSLAVGFALALALRGAAGASELLPRARSLRPPLPAAPLLLRSTARAFAPCEPTLAAAPARAPPPAST